jgi:hypothetical protein
MDTQKLDEFLQGILKCVYLIDLENDFTDEVAETKKQEIPSGDEDFIKELQKNMESLFLKDSKISLKDQVNRYNVKIYILEQWIN